MRKLYRKQGLLVILGIVLLMGWIGQGVVAAVGDSNRLTAVKVIAAPRIDGDATDAAWTKASEHEVSLAGKKVVLKAVYTEKDLSILASWNDSTLSMVRGGSWVWDGNAWNSKREGQSEDRIAFFWPINIPDFETSGCLVKCHPGSGAAGAFLNVPGQKGDMWHMKAARSLGVISTSQIGEPTIGEDYQATAGTFTLIGYADDKYVTYEDAANLPDDGGRHGDSGASTYGRNRNKDKTAPLYLEKNPTDYLDAMVLTQTEVDAGEVIEIAGATLAEINRYWDNYQKLSAVVPERILREPSESRADIKQAGTWSNGKWTIEIKRSLDTGNDDDIQFSDLSLDYLFGISLMDNAGGDAHLFSGVQTLNFTR